LEKAQVTHALNISLLFAAMAAVSCGANRQFPPSLAPVTQLSLSARLIQLKEEELVKYHNDELVTAWQDYKCAWLQYQQAKEAWAKCWSDHLTTIDVKESAETVETRLQEAKLRFATSKRKVSKALKRLLEKDEKLTESVLSAPPLSLSPPKR
jgi:hypothetical protein